MRSAQFLALCIKLHKNVWGERQYLFELPIITSRLTRAHLAGSVCAAGRAAAVSSSGEREPRRQFHSLDHGAKFVTKVRVRCVVCDYDSAHYR